jgi:hypothetical protein
MPPKLREVIEKVLDAGHMTQAELALKLYGSEKKQSNSRAVKLGKRPMSLRLIMNHTGR